MIQIEQLKSNDYKKSTNSYWKTFKIEEKEAYKVGVLFSDNKVNFECSLINEDIDLRLSQNDMTLEQFEDFAKNFYYSTTTKLKRIHNSIHDYSIDVIKPILMEIIEDNNIINNRKKENVIKRMYIFYFLRNELKEYLSYEKIGALLNYNKISVLYNVERAEELLKMEDSLFLSTIKCLKQDLFIKFKKHLKNENS